MTNKIPSSSFFDRIMGWAIPAVAGITPLTVIYTLVRPNVGQAFFFEGAVLTLVALLGLAWMLGWRALPERPTFTGWLLGLNALALLLSFTASQEWRFSLKLSLLPVCAFLFFGLIVIQPERRKLLERLRTLLTLEAGLLAVYGILQWRGYEFLNYGPQVEKNRIIATIGHPNYLASMLSPLLFAALGLGFVRRSLPAKLGLGALVLVLLACLALTQARGVWLGMVMGLVAATAVGMRYCRRRSLPMRWLAGLVLVGGIMAIGLGAVALKARQGRGIVDVDQQLTAQYEVKSRAIYWRAAIELALSKRFFGQGYAMFDPKFWDYMLAQQKSSMAPYYSDLLPAVMRVTPEHVHNEYMEVLAEEGFFGFTAFAALLAFFLFFGYWAIMRLELPGRALEGAMIYGGLVALMIDAFFNFPWRLPASLIVFMLVLAWLYDMIYPEGPGEATAPEGNVAKAA